MHCLEGDAEARATLDHLIRELERNLQDVAVDAGSLLIVDNYLAVHGRRAFKARFDGTDRWLKKTITTGDLRTSRGLRECPESRILL